MTAAGMVRPGSNWPSRRKARTWAITRGLFIRKVWLTGRVIWAAPSSRVEATETLPSFGPGMSPPISGLSGRLPAITPTSYSGRARRLGKESGAVPSSIPAGPISHWKAPRSPKRSTSSEPPFGGASITMRPISAGRWSASQARARMPPSEWVTKCTRRLPQAATLRPTPATRSAIGARVEG